MSPLGRPWSAPPPTAVLAPGEIHLWRVDLAAVVPTALSVDEAARAARLLSPVKSRQFAAGRSALRCILAGYLACPPAALRFAYGPGGKPVLDHPGPAFNLSHSGNDYLLAIGCGGPLGVDVERPDPTLDVLALATRFWSPQEAAWLACRPAARRRRAFYRLWTRREALAKGLGGGVGMALPPLVDGTGWTVAPLAGWRVANLFAGKGRVAALAWTGEVSRIVRYCWDETVLSD